MLRMIGYGDNAGSGFPTILDAWKGEKWRMPDLNEDAELHQVDLRLFTISLMPEECTIYLSDLLGKKTYQLLASEEQIILGTAYLENSVSNQRMQQILDLHPTDIGKLLSGLVDKEILLSERRGRWTTYKINKDYKKPSIQDKVTEDGNPNVTFKNETDKIIYEYICSNGFITTKQIVDSTIVGTSQGASVALKRLIDMKLIKKQGKGYLTRYILVKNSNSKKKNS